MAASEDFMARAAAMRNAALASGDQGFGAIVVKGDRIVAETPSRVVVNGDPTAHAEMEAIRAAARALGTQDLSDCIMYSTSKPCAMCETAAYWAGLEGMVFASAGMAPAKPRYRRC